MPPHPINLLPIRRMGTLSVGSFGEEAGAPNAVFRGEPLAASPLENIVRAHVEQEKDT